ncbi:MAG: HEPN domain-containing protein [Nitrospinae bacterium]|nr:HEPN domain-containing protein [Nitrospinota bacterium]
MTNEAERRLARADELLVVADENLRNGHPADCVSRAYYAMFHAATAALVSRGIERSSHKGIISAFGETFVKNGIIEKRFHEYMRKAFDARSLSDYFPDPSLEDIHPDEILASAKSFVEKCRELVKG